MCNVVSLYCILQCVVVYGDLELEHTRHSTESTDYRQQSAEALCAVHCALRTYRSPGKVIFKFPACPSTR